MKTWLAWSCVIGLIAMGVTVVNSVPVPDDVPQSLAHLNRLCEGKSPGEVCSHNNVAGACERTQVTAPLTCSLVH